MEQMNQLNGKLKKLKIPGMMNNLELRANEARDNDLGYIEFFSLLVQDEILNRESNNFEKRMKAAGFGIQKTFEGYDYNYNNEVFPSKMVRDLATCRFINNKQNLVIAGPPGIGKTHIIKALGHEMCRRGYDVLFKKTNDLINKLCDYSGKGDRLLKKCIKADVLILDDFAFRKIDQKESEMLYTLVDERLGRLPILITSNRPPQDWYGCFPDPVIGGAILDRLVSGAIKIIVNRGNTYRSTTGVSLNNFVDENNEK
ncbi:MAG: ATP-binding protein [bacterium]|nr:ATP-binding protein [bacterium]